MQLAGGDHVGWLVLHRRGHRGTMARTPLRGVQATADDLRG
ncbi:MAG: hypothetical protein ACRDSZ_17465 [Pseudonocardiaceae bacterium]